MSGGELTRDQQAALRGRLNVARIQVVGVATALVNHWRSSARRAKGGATSHRFYMGALAEKLDEMDALEDELLGDTPSTTAEQAELRAAPTERMRARGRGSDGE